MKYKDKLKARLSQDMSDEPSHCMSMYIELLQRDLEDTAGGFCIPPFLLQLTITLTHSVVLLSLSQTHTHICLTSPHAAFVCYHSASCCGMAGNRGHKGQMFVQVDKVALRCTSCQTHHFRIVILCNYFNEEERKYSCLQRGHFNCFFLMGGMILSL